MTNTRTPIILERCWQEGMGVMIHKTQALGRDGTPQLGWGPQDSSPGTAGLPRMPACHQVSFNGPVKTH